MALGETTSVCHLTTGHRPSDVRIYERECKSLVEEGKYEITIAAPGPAYADARIRFDSLGAPPRGRWSRFSMTMFQAARYAHRHDPGIWHLHDVELVPLGVWLARRGRVVIWDAHEDYEDHYGAAGSKSWLPAAARPAVRAGVRRALKMIDRSAAAVVAATPTIASRYRNSRTVVVGNEARVEDFADCRPEFANRSVLFTGSGGAGHLFDEVVQAVAAVPGLTLLVAGAARSEPAWIEAADLLGDRIRHLGWLDRGGLANAISECVAGFVTYMPTTFDLDEFTSPTKMYEFAAGGLPVVCSPIPACMKAVESGSIGVVAGGYDASSIADALREVIADESRWTEMSSDARSWANAKGNWSASAERLRRLYEDVSRVQRQDRVRGRL